MGVKVASILILGILLGLTAIWFLDDLNAGAVGLVILVSLAVATLIVTILSAILKRFPRSGILLAVLCFAVGFILVGVPIYQGTITYVPSPTPTRAYLLTGRDPFSGLGAYGYALLAARPSGNDWERTVRFADSYLRHFELLPSNWIDHPDRYLVTHWLLKDSIDQYDESGEVLVREYDYLRAKEMLSSIVKLDAKGPVLAAWDKPYVPGSKNEGLIIDLSRVSEHDFDSLFRIWAERIARDPRMWENGLKLVLFKEALRSLINQYGDQIVSTVEAAGLKIK